MNIILEFDDTTPTKDIALALGRTWNEGQVLENITHFGLKDIMLNNTPRMAARIINAIKREALRLLKFGK